MDTKHEIASTSVNASNQIIANSVLSKVFPESREQNGIEFSTDTLSEETEKAQPENIMTLDSILSRLENKKENAAVNLSISAEEVETMPFDLSVLETEGVFINVDCSGFGVLEKQLDWKSLGVELPSSGKVRLSPPRAGLLPDYFRRKLKRGQSQAHNALNKYSFRFTLCESVWGTSEYKWIPWNAYESFEQDYMIACETLAEAKAEVLAKYDEILIALRESFAELAEDSAKRLEATLDIPLDREEFRTNVVAHAMEIIPTRDAIRDDLTITMKPKVILLGSEMVAEQQKTRQLNLEMETIEASRQQIKLELDTSRQIEQLKINDFEIDKRREREVKERIRNMKIEAAREVALEAVSPIKEGFEQITGKVYEAAKEMTEKLQDADFVPGSLAKRARQMCEWYQLMNFTNDSSLENVLQKLKTVSSNDAKSRSPLEMRDALSDVIRAASINTKRLLDEDRMSALEF